MIFPASIEIVKDAVPNSSTSFPFTASPLPLANFALVDDGVADPTRDFTEIKTFGAYTVAEGAVSGWSLDSITCIDVDAQAPDDGTTTSLVGRSATIGLAEGENIRCTFVNSKQTGSLTVVKDLIPGADSGRFDLKIGAEVVANDIGDGGSGTRVLDPGSYAVSEDGAPDAITAVTTNLNAYSRSVECRNAADAIVASNASGSTVNVTVNPNDNITCTITNIRNATLTIVKQATPESAQSFDFDATGTGIAPDIDLVDDGTTANTQSFTLTAAQLGDKTITRVRAGGLVADESRVLGRDGDDAGQRRGVHGRRWGEHRVHVHERQGRDSDGRQAGDAGGFDELRLRWHRFGDRRGLRSRR